MLTLNQVKEILKNKDMPDKEAEEIRDGFYNLAEIIFEHWKNSLKQKNGGKNKK